MPIVLITDLVKALENFEKALKNYENSNKGFNIVTFLGENMSASSDDPEAVAAVLLFLSNLSQNCNNKTYSVYSNYYM